MSLDKENEGNFREKSNSVLALYMKLVISNFFFGSHIYRRV